MKWCEAIAHDVSPVAMFPVVTHRLHWCTSLSYRIFQTSVRWWLFVKVVNMWAYAHWAWASKIIISSSPVIQHVVACLVKLGKCNLHLESENILFSKISFCSHLRHWSHLYIFCTCSAVRFLQIFWNSCKEKMIMLSLFMALTMKFSASSCLRCTGFVFFFQVSVPSPLLWPHRPHSCPYSWTAFQLYFPDNLFPGMGWGTICTQNLGIARKGGALPLARICLEDLSTMPWGPFKVIIYQRW